MGYRTAIGWTNFSWNPWQGCDKVSPECAHCFMFRDKARYGQDPTVVVRSKTTFGDPLRWKDPGLCFTCSWSDFFHETADPWRAEAWDIIRRTRHILYQILTKRHLRIEDCLPDDWGPSGYPNVALGVSVGLQRFDYRVDGLLSVPARWHFVSAEPLIAPLTLERVNPYASPDSRRAGRSVNAYRPEDGRKGLDWVVMGGESIGKEEGEPRPTAPQWFGTLIGECERYGVRKYLKQLGGIVPHTGAGPQAKYRGRTYTEFPPEWQQAYDGHPWG